MSMRKIVLIAGLISCLCLSAKASERPAPVNPYEGRQEREEVFEFTEKPKVEKAGDKWVITFASKGYCDATVAVFGPNDKIVRHLASGVLGENAPAPLQQNSLSQKLEWNGKDDRGRPAPRGCKVRVSLGLKASYGGTAYVFLAASTGEAVEILTRGQVSAQRQTHARRAESGGLRRQLHDCGPSNGCNLRAQGVGQGEREGADRTELGRGRLTSGPAGLDEPREPGQEVPEPGQPGRLGPSNRLADRALAESHRPGAAGLQQCRRHGLRLQRTARHP